MLNTYHTCRTVLFKANASPDRNRQPARSLRQERTTYQCPWMMVETEILFCRHVTLNNNNIIVNPPFLHNISWTAEVENFMLSCPPLLSVCLRHWLISIIFCQLIITVLYSYSTVMIQFRTLAITVLGTKRNDMKCSTVFGRPRDRLTILEKLE